MIVSLVTHGLQAIVISLCVRHTFSGRRSLAAGLGVSLGVIIMVTGYSLGRAFIYSTPEYAISSPISKSIPSLTDILLF